MILCAGEALIDMLPRETADGPGFLPATGGAVFNTAIALGRLGAPTAFFTGLSDDLFGQRLAADLDASNVANRAAISDRPTTLAFVTLTDGHADYAFYDENTAGRMVAPADLPDTEGLSALFLGGISLAVEPCAETYETLAARNAHLPIMVDPNIRPGFIRDADRFRARLDRLLQVADFVKLSDEDLAWTGLTEADVLARGPKVLCLTEGAKGVTAITAETRTSLPARRVEVVDTVGAGDTFNAGFLAGLYRSGALAKQAPSENVLREAIDLGIQAAAITVSRAGANPPWSDEL